MKLNLSIYSGEHHLMIANAQIEDDAVFDCQVLKTATSDHLRSNPAQVTVYCKYKIRL